MSSRLKPLIVSSDHSYQGGCTGQRCRNACPLTADDGNALAFQRKHALHKREVERGGQRGGGRGGGSAAHGTTGTQCSWPHQPTQEVWQRNPKGPMLCRKAACSPAGPRPAAPSPLPRACAHSALLSRSPCCAAASGACTGLGCSSKGSDARCVSWVRSAQQPERCLRCLCPPQQQRAELFCSPTRPALPLSAVLNPSCAASRCARHVGQQEEQAAGGAGPPLPTCRGGLHQQAV